MSVGLIGAGPLALAGCTEGLPGGELQPRPSGVSFWKRFVVEPSAGRSVRDLRLSASVDFRVGGDPVNAFNWVDGYPLLQASKFGQWAWGLATPTLFDVLDTMSPFGLDPDAFSFQDAQGEFGEYSATFVFRRQELKPGEAWTIDLLYLAAVDDFALVQVYREALQTVKTPEPPDDVPTAPGASPVPLNDEKGRLVVRVETERFGFPIQSVEALSAELMPMISQNPIYREGIGVKYTVGFGERVFGTSEDVGSDTAELATRRLCGKVDHKGLQWSWCVSAPIVWLSI
jgi:hypothetical protein